jgi:hypothetical protein
VQIQIEIFRDLFDVQTQTLSRAQRTVSCVFAKLSLSSSSSST